MKFSIGLRLFFAFLLSIFGVAAIGVVLMAGKVSDSFSDYAIQIELNRLQEVSESLQMRYAVQKNWSFIPANPQEKIAWISAELVRLYQKKNEPDSGNRSATHADTDQRLLPKEVGASGLQPHPPTKLKLPSAVDIAADAMLPPLPPLPPVPPTPPMPPALPNNPPRSAPVVHAELPKPGRLDLANANNLLPSLYTRITLLDTDHHYLAGRLLDQTSNASRKLYMGDKVIGFLQVTKSNQPTDTMAKDFLQKQTDTILIIIGLSILLSAAAATLLAVHFRRPISRLVEGSRLLANGNFSTRLIEARSDELGELAHSFNQLADKLEQAEQTRRQWVADTSHELRTPISVLRAQLEAMQDGIRPPNQENIALMLRQILSLNKLIDELYALARADIGELQYQMQSLDVWKLVLEVADNFKEKLAANQLRLILSAPIVCSKVQGDPDRLRQVFTNLLENCCRYTAPGGCISLSVEIQKTALLICVDDSAPAVPDEALAQLGQRFYRVDPSRNRQQGGAGLGLALCARIIEAHYGKIEFSHAPTGGLRVQCFFPLERI